MKRALGALTLVMWPVAGLSDPLPYCGWAQDYCECGALFAVLETADGDAEFVAALREASQKLRQQTYMVHGQTAGERLFDAHVNALVTGEAGIQNAIDLAQRLQKCEPYLTGELSEADVLIIP